MDFQKHIDRQLKYTVQKSSDRSQWRMDGTGIQKRKEINIEKKDGKAENSCFRCRGIHA